MDSSAPDALGNSQRLLNNLPFYQSHDAVCHDALSRAAISSATFLHASHNACQTLAVSLKTSIQFIQD
jgi:hypothetical protein